jgi:predicted RNase H-like HicB family nuclease
MRMEAFVGCEICALILDEIITAMKLTAIFMKVPEGYIAFIEELPGANTQGATLEEARENLRDAVALVLEANRAMAEESMEGAPVIREDFELRSAATSPLSANHR